MALRMSVVGAGGFEVAGGGEDGVDGVVGVFVAVVVGVDAVLVPGGGHELHPADGAGGGDVLVAAVVGFDFVDAGQYLPAHAVFDAGGLVDRQQEWGDAELVDEEVGDADRCGAGQRLGVAGLAIVGTPSAWRTGAGVGGSGSWGRVRVGVGAHRLTAGTLTPHTPRRHRRHPPTATAGAATAVGGAVVMGAGLVVVLGAGHRLLRQRGRIHTQRHGRHADPDHAQEQGAPAHRRQGTRAGQPGMSRSREETVRMGGSPRRPERARRGPPHL